MGSPKKKTTSEEEQNMVHDQEIFPRVSLGSDEEEKMSSPSQKRLASISEVKLPQPIAIKPTPREEQKTTEAEAAEHNLAALQAEHEEASRDHERSLARLKDSKAELNEAMKAKLDSASKEWESASAVAEKKMEIVKEIKRRMVGIKPGSGVEVKGAGCVQANGFYQKMSADDMPAEFLRWQTQEYWKRYVCKQEWYLKKGADGSIYYITQHHYSWSLYRVRDKKDVL